MPGAPDGGQTRGRLPQAELRAAWAETRSAVRTSDSGRGLEAEARGGRGTGPRAPSRGDAAPCPLGPARIPALPGAHQQPGGRRDRQPASPAHRRHAPHASVAHFFDNGIMAPRVGPPDAARLTTRGGGGAAIRLAIRPARPGLAGAPGRPGCRTPEWSATGKGARDAGQRP